MTTKGHPAGTLGTGSYLPERVVTNEGVAKWVCVASEWIEERTLIRIRRNAAPADATSDLAVRAAERKLEQVDVRADGIDYIIVSTSTPDSPQPLTAALVRNELGATQVGCFDINIVCSGFPYGLALATSLQASNPGSHALVIGAEVYSQILDFDNHEVVGMSDTITQVGIVGSGVMGASIAVSCVRAGLDDRVAVRSSRSEQAGAERVTESTGRSVRKLKMTDAERDEMLARITSTTELADLGNRDAMFESGFASAADIDQAMKLGCAHPMGPLELADLIGLDVVLDIAEALHVEFREPHQCPPPLLVRMVDADLLGTKTGYDFHNHAA